MKDRFKAGKIRLENLDEKITLAGWVHSVRDHGGIIFVDLRDRSGITQVVFDNNCKDYEMAKSLRSEYVISVHGTVRRRSPETSNPELPTGEIELSASSLEILNSSIAPVIEINGSGEISEYIKMEHRYLYLRRPSSNEMLKKRSNFFRELRSYLDKHEFTEVDTPILTKSTPEGARDFLVPSRLNKGTFYALPQSPQIFKQLLMVAGVERYFQLAKCFRDEDLRADRQPEFMQLDMELSFATKEEITTLAGNMLREAAKKVFNIDIGEISIMKYREAMDRYGSDKPDLRYGLEIKDLTPLVKESGFSIFKEASKSGFVRAINAKGSAEIISRKDIDEFTKSISVFGARGLAWIKVNEDGSCSSVITKFLGEKELKEIMEAMGAEPGDTIFFVADDYQVVCESLGHLRGIIAEKMDLIDKNIYRCLWVVDFPLFEWSKEDKKLTSMHNPFTLPSNYIEGESNLEKMVSESYDLVLNGSEIAGGGLRIYKASLQKKVFEILGIDGENAEKQFGHLLGALRNGAPPHGGIAFGVDRILSIFMDTPSLRDIIPFPKTQKGQCPLTAAPSGVSISDLMDLGITVDKKD